MSSPVISQALLVAAETLALPFFIVGSFFNDKWRAALPERVVAGDWRKLDVRQSANVWIHAASVGEVVGITPLVVALRAKYPQIEIVISTMTLTGKAEALKRKLSKHVLLLPFDHPFFVRRAVAKIRPQAFIVAETELWPSFFHELAQQNVPIVLVNARLSDRSMPRYRRLKHWIGRLLQQCQLILVQGKTDAQRFCELGADPQHVAIVGSMKYDVTLPALKDSATLFKRFGMDPNKPVFVAGSVREGEDLIVLEAYREVLKTYSDLQLIVAPRHPERFEVVARQLNEMGIGFARRSVETAPTSVLLLDTIGELQQAYQVATVAFVGGTLVPIGGHNPFEPAAFAKPVILGPHSSNVRDAVQVLQEEGGVAEVGSQAELISILQKLLADAEQCAAMGEAAQRAWKRNLGATMRVMEELSHIVLINSEQERRRKP